MHLRVVQTQTILFLKSMSERGGSDTERFWNFFLERPKSFEDGVILIQSRSMSDPTLSDINFKNKMALVCTTLKISQNRTKIVTFLAENGNYSSSIVSEKFPFHLYFSNAPQPVFKVQDFDEELEIANGCWYHIKNIFEQLGTVFIFFLVISRAVLIRDRQKFFEIFGNFCFWVRNIL